MPFQLYNYFSVKGYLTNIITYQISHSDLVIAKAALIEDNHSFFINGLITYSSAINSIRKNNYSWAFIQSYYSIFYFARAFIGINNYGIIYINRKPYSIKIQPTEMFKKLKGNSHEVVLELFKSEFPSDVLISSDIDSMNPLDWFKGIRETLNYKQNPFPDPDPPMSLFDYSNKLRKFINIYYNDEYHTYTFTKEHSFLAYPLQLMIKLFEYYENNKIKNPYIGEERMNFFRNNLADENGPISFLTNRIELLSETI